MSQAMIQQEYTGDKQYLHQVGERDGIWTPHAETKPSHVPQEQQGLASLLSPGLHACSCLFNGKSVVADLAGSAVLLQWDSYDSPIERLAGIHESSPPHTELICKGLR